MARWLRWALLSTNVLAVLFLVDLACTPSQRALVPVAEKGACVLLRAFTESEAVDEVCATADDLAPFVPEILGAHASETRTTSAPLVALKMPPPTKRVRAPARRHCAVWVAADAGADADAGPR